MKYLYGLIAVGFCILSGLLGVAAGINLNPGSTIKFVPNWGVLADWIAAVAALLTFVVACVGINTWRVQERNRLALQWKADLVDYAFTLPYLPDQVSWPKDQVHIDKIAGKFYGCIRSYMLMVEYAKPEQIDRLKAIWNEVHDAHSAYLKGFPKAETVSVLTRAYNQRFV